MATKCATTFDDPTVPARAGEDVYAPLRDKIAALSSTRPVFILFDARHAAYRSIHTRNLSTTDGTPTSALHGLVELAMSLCTSCRSNRFAFVWDGSVDYKRSLYPEYKCRHDRERTPEEVAQHELGQRAIRVAVEGLGILGFPQHHCEGIEADDYIGLLARRLSAVAPVCIVTDDKDYYQLIRKQGAREEVFVWRGVSAKVVDHKRFVSEYGFEPNLYPSYKALVGEPPTGDNIPGVRGVGDITAAKMVAVHGDIAKIISHCRESVANGKPKKVERSIVEHANSGGMAVGYRLSTIMQTFELGNAPHSARSWERHGVDSDAIEKQVAYAVDKIVLSRHKVTTGAMLSFKSRYEFDSLSVRDLTGTLGFTLV